MEHIPVKSSNIESVGYDPDTRVMEVAFKSSGKYRYTDVSPEKHAAFVGADSAGKYFHQHIRPHHTCEACK